MRRVLILTCALTLIAVVAVHSAGYVVFLKNGGHIRAREPLEIKGNQAIITLATGTKASYPLFYIDLVKTERYNQLGLGDAVIIDELTIDERARPTSTPTPSLGGLATLQSGVQAVLTTTTPPTPTPTPGIRLQTYSYHDERVEKAFSEIFDRRKLYIYRTSAGTQPMFLFVQAVTDDQREVFAALKTVAEAYTIVHELHPDIAPEAVELEMVSTAGRPAGTFRLSSDMARSLTAGEISVEQFYVNFVIF